MIWLDSIAQLSYYSQQAQISCYCELLVLPSDLQMQHILDNYGNQELSVDIFVYSADGVTNYGEFTSYFTVSFGTNQAGQKYFVIKLNAFAPPMCDNECWILRVVIETPTYTLFDMWTERFCNADCCTPVTSVTVDGETFESELPKVGDCNTPMVRLETWFTCYDKFTGEQYNNGYRKITNIKGRYYRLPRTIQKDISMNCKVQRVQSFRLFEFEGWDMFPAWKMDEIELQLQADNIRIDGKSYLHAGGEVFTKPDNICQDIYLFKTQFQECNTWQIFGCQDCEPGQNAFYYILHEGSFYNEQQQYIGGTVGDIITYLHSQNGVSSAEVVSSSPMMPGSIISVTGTGYIPTFIYTNGLTQANRIYSTPVMPVVDECAIPVLTCAPIELGEIIVVQDTCATPVLGTISVTLDSDNMSWNPYQIPIFPVASTGSPAVAELDYTFLDLVNGELLSVEINGVPVLLSSVTFNNLTGDITLPNTVSIGQNVQILYKKPA